MNNTNENNGNNRNNDPSIDNLINYLDEVDNNLQNNNINNINNNVSNVSNLNPRDQEIINLIEDEDLLQEIPTRNIHYSALLAELAATKKKIKEANPEDTICIACYTKIPSYMYISCANTSQSQSLNLNEFECVDYIKCHLKMCNLCNYKLERNAVGPLKCPWCKENHKPIRKYVDRSPTTPSNSEFRDERNAFTLLYASLLSFKNQELNNMKTTVRLAIGATDLDYTYEAEKLIALITYGTESFKFEIAVKRGNELEKLKKISPVSFRYKSLFIDCLKILRINAAYNSVLKDFSSKKYI